MQASGFMIAAPASGSGKTSVCLGLLKAFQNKGFKVQSFKSGPDYIDTLLHSKLTAKPGINLDLFFSEPKQIEELFKHYSHDSDISIIEGVMGLFDGFQKSQGSTASIAKTLNIPVILVVDAKAVAYSIAPLLYGFKNFDPQLKLAGVIFNRVGSKAHYQYLVEAAHDIGIQSLGYIPNNPAFQLQERYLGLNFDHELDIFNVVDKIADQISLTVDMDKLVNLTVLNHKNYNKKTETINQHPAIKIAISKDEAFCFTYHENIRYLSSIGEIEYFSPLHDRSLPEADFVYLSGGYPEMYLEKLSGNTSMINSIKHYVLNGGRLLAECGGMMYLGKEIKDKNGQSYIMTGIYNYITSMQNKKLHMGYRKLKINEQIIKGHEFHYSTITNDEQEEKEGTIINAKEIAVDTFLYRKYNCYASYMHLYWGNHHIYQTLFEK